MDGSLESKISKFLFSYRITPQSTTGLAPAEILLGRRPRSRFDLLHPDIYKKVKDKNKTKYPKLIGVLSGNFQLVILFLPEIIQEESNGFQLQ